jgi:hypothetical protein
MICPQTLAFDVDGVLADTMTLFLNIAASEYQIRGISYEDITSYQLEDCLSLDSAIIDAIITRILDGNYTVPLVPITGASDVLARLGKQHGPVLFVTARPYTGPMTDWIQKALSLKPHEFKIIATGSFEAKASALRERGITHFVDDRLETCFSLKKAGIEPIVFRQPWNRQNHPFMEVASWRELETMISWFVDPDCAGL